MINCWFLRKSTQAEQHAGKSDENGLVTIIELAVIIAV